jgi:hypothetical protein
MIERTNRILRFMVSAICLAGVLGLCSCGDLGLEIPGLTDSEIADYQTVLANVEEAVPTEMDLTDETQYRFFVRQMQLSGFTADNSSELFTALELSLLSQANGSTGLCAVNGSNTVNELPTFSISKFETSDGMNYTATAEATLPVPVQVLTLTLELYDEDTCRIFSLDTEQKYNCSGMITLTSTGRSTLFSIPGKNITALLIWTYVSSSDGSPSTGLVRSTITTQP